MKEDELERILTVKDEIQPSSGFTASVMEAVRQEAATPPPIPFPWRRAAPGMAAAVAVLLSMVMALLQFSGSSGAAADSQPMLELARRSIEVARQFGAGWIVLALVLSIASVAVSMRLCAARA